MPRRSQPEPSVAAAATARSASLWREADGAAQAIRRDLPVEAAIGLSYDSTPYVVVMGSPADIEDLATGFTVTERIAALDDIVQVSVTETEAGVVADILLSPAASRTVLAERRRTQAARSSCGLCGIESLKQAVRPLTPLGPGPQVTRGAIQAALRDLETGQVLGARTRATHAAAWADPSGAIRLVREDVGRHNALDKLIGAALRAGLDPGNAFVVVTSRCSYEMVEKTAAAGVSILVAISAPTDLAVRQAEEANMTLVALARADGHCLFTGGERIREP